MRVLIALFIVLVSSKTVTSFILRTPRIRQILKMGKKFDYDLVIVGCGVGGHGAALHARSNGLKTAIFTGKDVGGTCVNRGCVPSKALLAAAGRIREMKNEHHLKAFGIAVSDVTYDRAGVAAHAEQLASKVKVNLKGSLKAHGVDIMESLGSITTTANQVRAEDGRIVTAKNIILAPGSIPFIPKGIQVDEKTVCTSDGALKLETVPQYVAIIGSGYIGLEFSDVYTALGSEVTFIEAADTLMPSFDVEIRRLGERLLIKPRAIDTRTGVLATEVIPGFPGQRPVTIKMVDAKTRTPVETLEVDTCLVATGRMPNTASLGLQHQGIQTDRGFVPVDDHMRVLSRAAKEGGRVVPGLYCIGDANGKMMLAHAASAQGISAVENILGRAHTVQHLHVPAACFTHPEIAMVGLTEEQARVRAAQQDFELGKSTGHFRANSKALAENEGDGIAKVLYNQNTGELLGVHIIGLHAADLIQECANAMVAGSTVRQLAMMSKLMGGAVGVPRLPFKEEWMTTFRAMKLTYPEIMKLFELYSLVDVDHNCEIDIVELLTLLDIEQTKFAERTFVAFDEDKSGQINFYEFVVSLWKFCTLPRGSISDFAFDLYDVDVDCYISTKEASQMCSELKGARTPDMDNTQEALLALNRKADDNLISKQNFNKFSKNHQALLREVYYAQYHMKKRTLGLANWESITDRRIMIPVYDQATSTNATCKVNRRQLRKLKKYRRDSRLPSDLLHSTGIA